MPDIAPIGPGSVGPVGRDFTHVRNNGSAKPEVPVTTGRLADRVELSEQARWLDRLQELPPVRREIVERVKQEIEAGRYPSEQQLATAIDRLMDDLDG